MIINGILSTDMAKHAGFISVLEKLVNTVEQLRAQGKPWIPTEEEHALLLQILMKGISIQIIYVFFSKICVDLGF